MVAVAAVVEPRVWAGARFLRQSGGRRGRGAVAASCCGGSRARAADGGASPPPPCPYRFSGLSNLPRWRTCILLCFNRQVLNPNYQDSISLPPPAPGIGRRRRKRSRREETGGAEGRRGGPARERTFDQTLDGVKFDRAETLKYSPAAPPRVGSDFPPPCCWGIPPTCK